MDRVDAAPPHDRTPDATALQLVRDGLTRRLRQHGGPMEPAQPLPDERLDEPSAVMARILREIRVIGRDQGNATPHGVAAPSQAQRAFGGDVHDIGLERIEEPRDRAELRERQPNRRIGRKRCRGNSQLGRIGRHMTGVAGRDDGDVVAEFAEHRRDTDHHRRDAVDLRRVSV